MDTEDDASMIGHEAGCDTAQHTDPAMDCASPTVDTHGLVTHIAYTADGPRAYAEPGIAGPLVLTAAACIDLATRFSHLGHLLLRR